MLRALGLGDLLTGLPALRALRRRYAGHRLVLAAPGWLQPLVELSGTVDALLQLDGREVAGLQQLSQASRAAGLGSPDVAVNLHGRGPQSHSALWSLQPGLLVGFGCGAHRGPQWREDEHEVRRWSRLVAEELGTPADPEELLLPRPGTASPAPGAVVVHPGAAYPARRWPADRYAAVAGELAGRGHRVVLTGTAGEVALAGSVRRGARLPAEAVLAGGTDLAQLAALVASARLVVCGDTGMAHLASAFGTPSVLLFGPTSPVRWGPPADGPHRVLWHGDGTGDPWGDDPDPALLRITVAEVCDAAAALLDRAAVR